jgi:hypothetical protein
MNTPGFFALQIDSPTRDPASLECDRPRHPLITSINVTPCASESEISRAKVRRWFRDAADRLELMTNGLVGFFHLQSPEDLFMKLQRDFRRLRSNPADSDAAFDFFVTATHIPEWLRRAQRLHKPPTSPRERALLAICAHLGNGAKHFVVNRHDAVQHGDVGQNTYGSASYGSALYGVSENLLVTLSRDEAAALGIHQSSALALAGEVLDYWSQYLGMPSSI